MFVKSGVDHFSAFHPTTPKGDPLPRPARPAPRDPRAPRFRRSPGMVRLVPSGCGHQAAGLRRAFRRLHAAQTPRPRASDQNLTPSNVFRRFF